VFIFDLNLICIIHQHEEPLYSPLWNFVVKVFYHKGSVKFITK